MALKEFKNALEKHSNIHRWSPSDAQLKKIALEIKARIASGQTINQSDLQGIITACVKDTVFVLFEGVDNADLKTLLLLATKVAESSNG